MNAIFRAALAGCAFVGCSDTQDIGQNDAGQLKGDASAHEAGRGGKDGAASPPAQQREVKIRFRASVGDRDFSCAQEYEQLGATKVRAAPGDFRFYVQDLKLVSADGQEVPVAVDKRAPWQTPDVALVDFEDMTGVCHGTPDTNDYVSGTVPAGDYKGIVFSNGVPEALNHLEQSTQPPPLDLTDMYWAWLTGYRFFVVEFQQAGLNVDDGAGQDAGVARPGVGLLHIGSTACRKDKGCTKKNRNEIRLEDFDPESDVIVADAAAVFVETDIRQDMQCHSADETCAPMYPRAGVIWETGESDPSAQKLYRVEPYDHIRPAAGGSGDAGSGGKSARAGSGGAGGSPGSGGANATQTQAVTIKFKAKVGDQDFACGKTYANRGTNGSTVTPQDMRLFIQELALIKEDGTRVPVTFESRAPWQSDTVALLDFENQAGNCLDGTRDTNTELTGNVVPGTYKGVSFVNGVPGDINHADPATLSDPLVASARLCWSWQAGFRFAKIELANTEGGENDLGRAFFHPGATACTGNAMQGTVNCAKPNRTEIVFEEFDPGSDTVIIDVAELFNGTNLEQPNECHSTPQNVCNPNCSHLPSDDRAGPRRSAVLRSPPTGSRPLQGDRGAAGRRGTNT